VEKLTLPARLENLDLMMDVVLKNADRVGFSKKDRFQIKLATEEILVNIINYGYPATSGAIELEINPKPDEGIEIVFMDWGIAFNPLSLPEPDVCHTPLKERKVGGLGVFLVRKIMDQVSYKREDGRNILTITKKLNTDK
jgi:serine/threonine-protein kinase RsbW